MILKNGTQPAEFMIRRYMYVIRRYMYVIRRYMYVIRRYMYARLNTSLFFFNWRNCSFKYQSNIASTVRWNTRDLWSAYDQAFENVAWATFDIFAKWATSSGVFTIEAKKYGFSVPKTHKIQKRLRKDRLSLRPDPNVTAPNAATLEYC